MIIHVKKNTRGRNLEKKHPEKYNLGSIIERLETKELSFTVEKWQIDHMTSKGFYLNVDFGIADRGQILIGGYKVDQLENGDCVLYLKKNETFRLLSEKEASFTKYLTGRDLAKQLGLYNGTVPLKKEPVISTRSCSLKKLIEKYSKINLNKPLMRLILSMKLKPLPLKKTRKNQKEKEFNCSSQKNKFEINGKDFGIRQ